MIYWKRDLFSQVSMMFADHSLDEMPKSTVTAFIEDDLKEGLKALADKERRSMSQMIAVLIERAVDEARAAGEIPQQESKP